MEHPSPQAQNISAQGDQAGKEQTKGYWNAYEHAGGIVTAFLRECGLAAQGVRAYCPPREGSHFGFALRGAVPLFLEGESPAKGESLTKGESLARQGLEAHPPRLGNAPFIGGIGVKNGTLRITLTREALEALARAAVEKLPPQKQWLCEGCGLGTREGYAMARMGTLARKGDKGLPQDEAALRALWLALGICAYPGDAARTRARLKQAVEALLTMSHHLPPRERAALMNRCGLVGMAAEKLIFTGIQIIGGMKT